MADAWAHGGEAAARHAGRLRCEALEVTLEQARAAAQAVADDAAATSAGLAADACAGGGRDGVGEEAPAAAREPPEVSAMGSGAALPV